MTDSTQKIDEHIGARLSGFIDGELTQQERQYVDVHCATCERCRHERDELRELRAAVGGSALSEYGEDKWRETLNDTAVRVTRGIGWLLLIGGVIAASGVAVFGLLADKELAFHHKLIVGALYGGTIFLFISVLRQRLIERKTDKYNDVGI